MDSIKFSRSELESLTKSQLQILSDYYGIEYKKRTTQREFVELLVDYYKETGGSDSDVDSGNGGQQMSVRVRRIKESAK